LYHNTSAVLISCWNSYWNFCRLIEWFLPMRVHQDALKVYRRGVRDAVNRYPCPSTLNYLCASFLCCKFILRCVKWRDSDYRGSVTSNYCLLGCGAVLPGRTSLIPWYTASPLLAFNMDVRPLHLHFPLCQAKSPHSVFLTFTCILVHKFARCHVCVIDDRKL